jgi:Ethanolamine utilization protein EutJ (predicted chaperonin)
MKKVSTVAAKQSKNFSRPKLTIGLDLGDRSSWYCVLDEQGEVLLEVFLADFAKCPILCCAFFASALSLSAA